MISGKGCWNIFQVRDARTPLNLEDARPVALLKQAAGFVCQRAVCPERRRLASPLRGARACNVGR
eukprot:489193-Pyramimonas_sp.AAC.2